MLAAAAFTLALALQPQAGPFVERPCVDERIAETVRCGRVEVPENWDVEGGRRIALNIVIVPAAAPTPGSTPLYDLAGGPGLPATTSAAFYLMFGQAYWASRDVVLIDQRGTGASNPLHCPELAGPETRYAPMLDPAAVGACRDRLLSTAALDQYSTDNTVRDMDAVRQALGHGEIDIFALSYGTTVALRFMAAFPDAVRAAVLMGAAPATTRPPSGHAPAGERALRLLFEDCAADALCAGAFPDPAGDLQRAVTGLTSIEDAPLPEVFLERLRSLAYTATGARQIPYIVRQAADGDLGPFYAATAEAAPSILADGLFMSVVCSEAMAHLDYEAAAAAARATVLGDYRLSRQRSACAAWPVAQIDESFFEPVHDDAAILFIAGRLDPVTPPDLAELASQTLPNSRVITLEHGGHIIDGLSGIDTCFDAVLVRFYETADAVSLDTSCVAGMAPPPFQISAEPDADGPAAP